MAKATSINKGLILSMGVAFLIQAGGFIWWMSGLNSEVQRLSGIQGISIPALEAEVKLDGIAIQNMKQPLKNYKNMIKLFLD